MQKRGLAGHCVSSADVQLSDAKERRIYKVTKSECLSVSQTTNTPAANGEKTRNANSYVCVCGRGSFVWGSHVTSLTWRRSPPLCSAPPCRFKFRSTCSSPPCAQLVEETLPGEKTPKYDKIHVCQLVVKGRGPKKAFDEGRAGGGSCRREVWGW